MGLRINHNLASLNAALNLGRANGMLSKSLARLSTGLKINNAADGPADLIISEKFRSQINAISKATENTQNAISMLSTAEGALTEVNSLLNKMKGLALKATQTGTQDPDEIAASQAEIDAALASINSIARNTSFGSKFLLDGSLDIATNEVDTDNIGVQIERAVFAGAAKRVSLDVLSQSQQAENSFDLNTSGLLDAAQTFKITGNRGSSTITFASGAAGSDIAKEINDQTTQTAVTATYDSTNQKIILKSADFGATEYATIEDVDGTNDILKAELAEQKTNAYIDYGNQFQLVSKTGGVDAEKIAIKINETMLSNPGGTNGAKISITQDASSGTTNVLFDLEIADSIVFSGTGVAGKGTTRALEGEVITTLSEIKSLIESNSVLDGLVEFKLQDGSSLTDIVGVNASFTKDYVGLRGGASGEAATTASLTLGSATAGSEITFKSKTAGAGGNDIQVIFGTSTNIREIALNSSGETFTSDAAYFSTIGGTSQIFFSDDVLYVHSSATFQQISDSIQSNTAASAAIDVSFTGKASEQVTKRNTAHFLSGGTGITGGRRAQSFIDLSTANNSGISIKSTKAGADGNDIQLILRNRGGYNEGTVSVSGNTVIVNLSVANSGGSAGTAASAEAVYGRVLSTSTAAALALVSNYEGSYFNQFDIRVFSVSGLAAPAVNFDSSNNRILLSVDFQSTTYSALSTAVTDSSAILDTSTGMKLSEVFYLSSSTAVVSLTNSTITGAGGAVGGSLDTSLITGYFSATTTTLGIDASVTTSASGLIALIRKNASASALLDLELGTKKGETLQVADLKTVGQIDLTTNVVATTAGGATDAVDGAITNRGDLTFNLTGGYNGEVSTNVVRKDGVDGSVKFNGVEASANNLSFTFDNGDVRGTVTLDENFNKTGNSTSFTINSKGAFFQIGQKAQLSYQAGIALRNISANSLGSGLYFNPDYDTSLTESSSNKLRVVGNLADIASGSKFDLAKNANTALDIINAAITDISTLRSQVGAFISNTLESNINSLGVAFENLTAAESRIRDVDFAAETAEFTRAQILVQAGTSIAAQANVATQAALQLLG